MTPLINHYPILGYTIKSAVPLYAAPLSPDEEPSDSKTAIICLREIPPRLGRDLSCRNPRQYLRAYRKRSSVLYGDATQIKIAFYDQSLIVEQGVLAHPAYQLALLKTVIPAIGTLERRCFLHASAVAFGEEAVIILGPSGYGKSTLATYLEFLGAEHLSDDITPLSSYDGSVKVTPARVGRMLLPAITKSLFQEFSELQLGSGYEIHGKTWHPSFKRPRYSSYRSVGVVVLGGTFTKCLGTAIDADSQETALKVLLQSFFGPFDFATHLAQTYLPIFGELIRQAEWNYFERPESVESFRNLAETIVERYQR